MAVERLVLFLALASLVAVNAASSGRFIDFISSGSKVKAQSAYEEVDTTSSCLQISGCSGCRCADDRDGTCYHGYSIASVSCCQSVEAEKKYSSAVEDLLADQAEPGTCNFEEEFFDSPIRYEGTTHDVMKIGQFFASCNLKEDATKCGEPLCDGMTLEVKGYILRYNLVAFIHDLVEVPMTDGCPLKYPTYDTAPAPAPAPVAAKLQYSKGGEDGGDDAPNFKVGQGDIYCGVYTIMSAKHKIPYKDGHFEMIKHTAAIDTYVDALKPPEKCYVAKDGAIALDNHKSGGSSY